MVQLKNVSLIRTSRDYENASLKNLAVQAFQAPLHFFTKKKITEYFLKEINLTINHGEKVALIGRNGSGKSTLCRVIAKQLFPSSGQLHSDIRINLFSQIENCFFRELTGRENLEFLFDFIYENLSPEKKQLLIDEAIDFSGLEKKIDRPIENYSLGMISRLALSLITAHPHDFLILDEVHTHADSDFRKKISGRLERIIKNSKSFLLVSHYEEDVTKNCQRGILLDHGKVLFDGPIEKAIALYNFLPKETHV